MDIQLKTISLYTALVLTGLSAGLFYAWSVSVIPGTQKIDDSSYLYTMQSINRAIINPAFFLIFFGSQVALLLSSYLTFGNSNMMFWLLVAASAVYLFGTIGITGLGNVPLNDQLDALNLKDFSAQRMAEFRKYYESNWNRFHLYRTAFAVISFLLVAIAAFKIKA